MFLSHALYKYMYSNASKYVEHNNRREKPLWRGMFTTKPAKSSWTCRQLCSDFLLMCACSDFALHNLCHRICETFSDFYRSFDNWTIWTFYAILHSRFSIAVIAWYKKKLNENARFRSIILHTIESVAMPATLKIIIIYLLMSKRYLPQHRSNSENRSTID